MGSAGFTEAQHPRDGDGRFTAGTRAESDVDLTGESPPPPPADERVAEAEGMVSRLAALREERDAYARRGSHADYDDDHADMLLDREDALREELVDALAQLQRDPATRQALDRRIGERNQSGPGDPMVGYREDGSARMLEEDGVDVRPAPGRRWAGEAYVADLPHPVMLSQPGWKTPDGQRPVTKPFSHVAVSVADVPAAGSGERGTTRRETVVVGCDHGGRPEWDFVVDESGDEPPATALVASGVHDQVHPEAG